MRLAGAIVASKGKEGMFLEIVTVKLWYFFVLNDLCDRL